MPFEKNNKPQLTGFTDDELIRIAMSAAGQFIKNNQWNQQQCLDAELTAIKEAYKKKFHRYRSYAFKPDELSAIAAVYDRLKDILTDRTLKKLTSMKKNEKMLSINMTTAKAIITGALESSGLSYHITEQKYRLKVHIELERQSVILLHIYYKDIAGKNIDGLVPALQTINTIVSKH